MGSHSSCFVSIHYFCVDGAKFDKPPGILLLDNTKKIIIADEGNDRLVVLDRENKLTSILCTGEEGHGDGDLRSCSLVGPRSLLVIGNTLFIGEYQRIRMLSGISFVFTATEIFV